MTHAGQPPTHDQVQVRELADQLAEILSGGVGTRSKWALRSAVDAAQTDGVAGMICIQIPSKAGQRAEVSFTVGIVELVSRWGGA